jgi:hypothetical protein
VYTVSPYVEDSKKRRRRKRRKRRERRRKKASKFGLHSREQDHRRE